MGIVAAIILGILLACLCLGFSVASGNHMLAVWFIRITLIGLLAYAAMFAILLVWPRKGAIHAYRNRVNGWALGVVGVSLAVFLLLISVIISARIPWSDLLLWAQVAGGILLTVAYMVISWQALVPTFGLQRLRKIAPKAVRAIRRYRKFGESLGHYSPALEVEGLWYFPATYSSFDYQRGGLLVLRGLLVLDEQGQLVRDRDLMQKLGPCYRLAMATISDQGQIPRIGEVSRTKRYLKALDEAIPFLRELDGYFQALGEEGAKAIAEILSAEEALRRRTELGIARETMEAQWGVEHGLTRLVEVHYAEVRELEKGMQTLLQPRYDSRSSIVRAGQAAAPLLAIIEAKGMVAEVKVPNGYWSQRYYLHERDRVKNFLSTTAEIGEMVAGQGHHYEFPGFSDSEWLAWNSRMEWVDQVEGRRKP
jgi:hypothetical protein